MLEPGERERFDTVMLPHLGAAYNLARYLLRDDHDAEDVVQEAFLRALKYFRGFRDGAESSSRAWLLTIVRNTAYTWRQRHQADALVTEFDEAQHSMAIADVRSEAARSSSAARATLADVFARMSPAFREVIVLRELEGLSYQEISEVVGVPIGTVMSRLSRARKGLQEALMVAHREDLR